MSSGFVVVTPTSRPSSPPPEYLMREAITAGGIQSGTPKRRFEAIGCVPLDDNFKGCHTIDEDEWFGADDAAALAAHPARDVPVLYLYRIGARVEQRREAQRPVRVREAHTLLGGCVIDKPILDVHNSAVTRVVTFIVSSIWSPRTKTFYTRIEVN